MKSGEDAKQAALAQVLGAGAEGGIDMKPTDLLKNQSHISDGSEITKAALGAGPSITPGNPDTINDMFARADVNGPTQAPPVIVPGSTGDIAPVPGQQSQTDISPQLPESTEFDTGGGDPSKMSLEAKMAIAAQLGSLARGPGAPPPPHVGAGPGINMQPVFLKDLPRG